MYGGGIGVVNLDTHLVITSQPPAVVSPTITGVQALTHRKTNKHGKPVGKPTLVGFTIEFSTAMSASADDAADYEVQALKTIKRVRKVRVPVYQNVAFTATYSAPSSTVTLTLVGRQTFRKGGLLSVIATPPDGLASASGDFLAAPSQFAISAGARLVTPA